MIHDTQSAQISQKQDERNIYVTMKTMCPPGYHHNGLVATHAPGHMMYGSTLLVPMRFEHSVCRGSLMTTNITLLALLVEHSLVHWYQQCGTVHHVPRCMGCHKAIVVITGRAHCFHGYIYTYIYIYIYIYIDFYLFTINVYILYHIFH